MPPSQPDLLAYALFDLDPRARGLQKPLQTFLASLALYERGSPATREEIRAACREHFLSNDEIDQSQMDAVIASAVKAGLMVKVEESKVDLSEERRQQLEGAADRIASHGRAFHAEIVKAVEAELGEKLPIDLVAKLGSELDEFIQRLFQDRSVSLAQSFGPEGKGFDDEIAGLVSAKSLESMARSLTSPSEKLRSAQIAQGIRSGLLALGNDGQRHLAAVYQKTVAFALLQQDPSVRKVRRGLAEKRIFYLDTNVAMAFMFSAHTAHERVKIAVEAAKEIGCKLLVSPFTIEELETQLRESDEAFKRLHTRSRVFAIVDDDILRTFAERRDNAPGLTWPAFYAEHFPPADVLKELDIELDDSEAANARHDARRDRVRAAVASRKPAHSHPKLIDYDTDNILLVQLRRTKIHADEMGNRVWFVTLDRSLKAAERRLLQDDVFSVPSTKQVGSWTADLSPHLSPDDPDLGEYVLHLVQSQVGVLAEDPVFADVNFLATLQESPFDIDQLLEGDPAKTRRVLVALQEEREIQDLLGREPDEASEKEAWANELAALVAAALAKLDSSSEDRAALEELRAERDRAIRSAGDLKKERDQSLRRAAELEREMAPAPASGVWGRIRRFLRLD